MIYVIKCEHNCYYVGKTERGAERILEHLAEAGSQWTKLHKPLEIVEQIQGDGFIEDAITKRYMSLYGIESVRGGSYCQFEISILQRQQLIRELRGAQDCCFHCGLTGHFIQDCPSKQPVQTTAKKSASCDRCGRDHNTSSCYAARHLDGRILDPSQPTLPSAVQAQVPIAKAKKRPPKQKTKDGVLAEPVQCQRCGRDHKTSSCYAARHLDGRILEKRIATQPAPVQPDPPPSTVDQAAVITPVNSDPPPSTVDQGQVPIVITPLNADPPPAKPKENCVCQ